MAEKSIDERITIKKDDITRQETDAIVNAANTSLLGGGGVDGAIHRAAGPQLLEECRSLGGCPTGDAKLTQGYNLPAKYVIHTVGPVWKGGEKKEEELLASCYRKSLQVAVDNRLATISFPSISTGVYGFPFKKACRIALREIRAFLAAHSDLKEVRLVCFSDSDYQMLKEALEES